MKYLKNFIRELNNSPAIIMTMSIAIIFNEIVTFSGILSLIWIVLFSITFLTFNKEYRRKY